MAAIIPNLDSYSKEDIDKASSTSPALQHYLNLIRQNPKTQSEQLRCKRHRAWCEAALATVLKTAHPQSVCLHWSNAADLIVTEAWNASGCAAQNLAFFALGKWGSQELNLSSDIDVIFVSQENPSVENFSTVRRFIQLLTESNDFGFCFRVDTDLKPGGRLAPLISSVQQFENYYWSSGAMWERLALVRLRKIVGSEDISTNIPKIVERFVFRKFLDFSLLDDLQLLRSQIHSHYPQLSESTINLKLAPGGIRDIELFIHALQVIHGGKSASLRTTSTSKAAAELIAHQRFKKEDLQQLISLYWEFRQLENYVQALSDQQTHDWTTALDAEEFEKFKTNSRKVDAIVENVLGKSTQQNPMPTQPEELTRWLDDLGYSKATIEGKIPELISLSAVSARTYQDEDLRLRVLSEFLVQISHVALDKDLGVALLIDFIRATRVKSGFFSLLIHENRLIKELSLLFGCSPYLGGILAQRPELLDSFLYRAQPTTVKRSSEQLFDELLERKLLNEIIAATAYLNKKNVTDLGLALTTSADEICMQLLETIKHEFEFQSSIEILALGKWGGRELGFQSDLDFIFLTQGAATENDHKIARRFLSRLTERHRGGVIYSYDMRLRPSGKAGPILVQFSSLIDYLKATASAWERQSYLKSRFLVENQNQTQDILVACTSNKLREEDLAELKSIRKQLIAEDKQKLDLKYSAGGLVDVEFAVQIEHLSRQLIPLGPSTLTQISSLENIDSNWISSSEKLKSIYEFLRTVEQLFQLVNQHNSSSLDIETDGFQRVSKLLNAAPDQLAHKITSALKQSDDILKLLDLRQHQK